MEELGPALRLKAPPPAALLSSKTNASAASPSTSSSSTASTFTSTAEILFTPSYSHPIAFPDLYSHHYQNTLPSDYYSTSFFLDSSTPATPVYSRSASSSFANIAAGSGVSSVNQSSCSSPTTEFSLANLSTEPPMPRLSEEQCFTEYIDIPTNLLARQMHRSSYSTSDPNPLRIKVGDASDLNTSEAQDADLSAYASQINYDLDNALFSDALSPSNSQTHRRQKSGESNKTNLSSKISNISFFHRRRHRKNSSLSTNPTVDTGVSHSSRSSSFASARHHDIGSSTTSLQRTPNIAAEPSSSPASPFDVLFADYIVSHDPIDRFKHSSTPLLPPMMEPDLDDTIIPSPLQSPTIADGTQSISRASIATSDGSRSLHETGACDISKRPSVNSIGRTRKSTGVGLEASVSMPLASPDKWSMKLGHANFTIEPEPYFPDIFDLVSWQMLLSDREAAHAEFCRHQARTLEHYGRNSKTYMITEEKWAEIDAEWANVVKTSKAEMVARGIRIEHLATTSTTPMARMPTMNPHLDGKFPKLGDEDIVGPMVQSPPLQQPSRHNPPTRKPSSAKLFSGKLGGIFGKVGDNR